MFYGGDGDEVAYLAISGLIYIVYTKYVEYLNLCRWIGDLVVCTAELPDRSGSSTSPPLLPWVPKRRIAGPEKSIKELCNGNSVDSTYLQKNLNISNQHTQCN